MEARSKFWLFFQNFTNLRKSFVLRICFLATVILQKIPLYEYNLRNLVVLFLSRWVYCVLGPVLAKKERVCCWMIKWTSGLLIHFEVSEMLKIFVPFHFLCEFRRKTCDQIVSCCEFRVKKRSIGYLSNENVTNEAPWQNLGKSHKNLSNEARMTWSGGGGYCADWVCWSKCNMDRHEVDRPQFTSDQRAIRRQHVFSRHYSEWKYMQCSR